VRDRRGRGLRGELAPRVVPRNRTRGEQFDELVLDAVEELEARWAAELAGVEFAVEDVPSLRPDSRVHEFDPEVIVDRGVPLGRLLRTGIPGAAAPTIVVYRRPVETRARNGEDRADLVFMVVAELVAELLGRDVDEIDPPNV
jgi:predicted Zn-dependent protease with MMP-like domain